MTLAGLGDPERTLANATVYLEAAGHVVVAWMWLEQLVAVGEKAGDFYDGKRAAARYFFRWELPKVAPDARPAGLGRHHHAGDARGLVLGRLRGVLHERRSAARAWRGRPAPPRRSRRTSRTSTRSVPAAVVAVRSARPMRRCHHDWRDHPADDAVGLEHRAHPRQGAAAGDEVALDERVPEVAVRRLADRRRQRRGARRRQPRPASPRRGRTTTTPPPATHEHVERVAELAEPRPPVRLRPVRDERLGERPRRRRAPRRRPRPRRRAGTAAAPA